MKSNNYLVHYASPYYDPVKAHEYYMKNRDLKGRLRKSYSLTNINEKGQEAYTYVNKQLADKRKFEAERLNKKLERRATATITEQKARVISLLADKSKHLSHYEKRRLRIKLMKYIDNARKALDERKANANISLDRKYNAKKAQEYDKIVDEFKKTKQSKTNTVSKKTYTSSKSKGASNVPVISTGYSTSAKRRERTSGGQSTPTLKKTIINNRNKAIRNKYTRR